MSLFAQTDTSRYEINAGINYFPPAVQSTSKLYDIEYGYLVGLKKSSFGNNKIWYRAGINFNCTRLFKLPYDYSKGSVGINLGIERRLFPKKLFSVTIAADVVPHYSIFVSKWNLQLTRNIGYGIMLGPVVGVTWNINSKASLGTEINYNYGYFVKIVKSTNYYNKRDGFDIGTHRLLGLIFNYKF